MRRDEEKNERKGIDVSPCGLQARGLGSKVARAVSGWSRRKKTKKGKVAGVAHLDVWVFARLDGLARPINACSRP